MKLQITPPILRAISEELKFGDPIWAILRANEYLHPTDPIHKAMVFKARSRMDLKKLVRQETLEVLAGACLSQISNIDQVVTAIESSGKGGRMRKRSKFVAALRKRSPYQTQRAGIIGRRENLSKST